MDGLVTGYIGLVILGLLVMPSSSPASELLTQVKSEQRCEIASDNEPIVYRKDFTSGHSIVSMIESYEEMYRSDKRLVNRAYFEVESNQFVINWQKYGGKFTKIVIPENFIKNMILQIEEGLRREYAHHIFFPDMGHNHFLVPLEYYNSKVKEAGNVGQMIEMIIRHPEIKMVYHTSELLKVKREDRKTLIPDPQLQWRYYLRNLVGLNDGSGKIEIHKQLEGNYNTVRSEEGYKWWGAGFYIHASKNGCIPFYDKGVLKYFDISITSFPESGPVLGR